MLADEETMDSIAFVCWGCNEEYELPEDTEKCVICDAELMAI